MSQLVGQLTPIDATVEIQTLCFDFGPLLAANGEKIVNIISLTCESAHISRLKDDNAASRVIGQPQIQPSPATGVENSAVYQQFGQMVGGVVYLLQIVVLTDHGNQESGWVHLPCVTPL